MHFYYLDEAGCTGRDLTNAEQPIFVLGGISVRDEGWHRTQQSLQTLLNQYFSNNVPAQFELHADELLSPNGDGPFAGHERDRRNSLAKDILGLLGQRSHAVHLFALDKSRMRQHTCDVELSYDPTTPYLLAYDYLLTYIDTIVKNVLGRSARAMLIIDAIEEYHADIESVSRSRRYNGAVAHQIKRIVEFTYPVDSKKNPMVQLSDLVVFCSKKFLEIDNGYRDEYPQEAKTFYAECYALIHERIRKKELVDRAGRGMVALNEYLRNIQSRPNGQWKRRYSI